MSANLLTMIVPLRDGASADHLKHPCVDLIELRGPLPSIAQGFLDGICRATTPWVILGNDDITIPPNHPADPDWVARIESAIRFLNDDYWLLHPDDGIVGAACSTFPILNRQVVLEHLDLIPPFRRYGLDPHIHAIFRACGRVKYLPEVLFDHANFYTADTVPEWADFLTLGKDGRIFCAKPGPDRDFDNDLVGRLVNVRSRVAQTLFQRIQEDATKSSVGWPVVTRAEFLRAREGRESGLETL